MKRTYLSIAIATIFASSAWAGNGQGSWQEGKNSRNGQNMQGDFSVNQSLLEQPLADISETEAATLTFMREEEKMARDVYLTLYDVWQIQSFASISRAEQQHMDQLKSLLDSYDLPDPVLEDVGIFANSTIQNLYDSLVERGRTSEIEALHVGGLVEEVDIADLQNAIAETENVALIGIYTNLLKGSYNHLRAFVRNIESLDYTYEAQSLAQNEVDNILNPTNVTSGVAVNTDNSQFMATNATFKPSIKTQNGVQSNGTTLSQNDDITLNMNFQADRAHLGQNADLLTVATFTSTTKQQMMYMRNEKGNWQNWDGSFNTLTASEVQQPLRNEYNLTVYQGRLPKGKYQISAGYRLQDATIVFNEEAMDFSVEE